MLEFQVATIKTVGGDSFLSFYVDDSLAFSKFFGCRLATARATATKMQKPQLEVMTIITVKFHQDRPRRLGARAVTDTHTDRQRMTDNEDHYGGSTSMDADRMNH